MPDQHERAEAHDLPAQDDLDHVSARTMTSIPAESNVRAARSGVAAVAAHVLQREDQHQQRDEARGGAASSTVRRCADRCVNSTPLYHHSRSTGWTNGRRGRPSASATPRANPAGRPIGPAVLRAAAARCARSTGRRRRRRPRATPPSRPPRLGPHRQALAEEDDDEEPMPGMIGMSHTFFQEPPGARRSELPTRADHAGSALSSR